VREGQKWEGRAGGLDLDICPGAPEFLITPLNIGKAPY